MKVIKTKIHLLSLIYLMLTIIIFSSPLLASRAEIFQQNFTLNNEIKTILDEESSNPIYNYNGSITVTISFGGPVIITVNALEVTLSAGQTHIFPIINLTRLFFEINAERSFAEGFFLADLNLEQNPPDRLMVILVLTVGAGLFLCGILFITYQTRREKLQPTDEEQNDELLDKEAKKKRLEAAAAEKRFWGKD